MTRTRARPSTRFRKRSFAETVEFPRWIVAASIVVIGLMLLLGRTSEPDGRLNSPGVAGYLYLAVVVIGAGVVCFYRKGNGGGVS